MGLSCQVRPDNGAEETRTGAMGDNPAVMMTEEIAERAVAPARAALVEQVGESVVGDYLASIAEGDGVLTVSFACTQAGYPGWYWAVTVVQPDGQAEVTVDEVVLLPGEEAITAPAW